ncbi:hypothetical protein CANCADRAFT_121785 [Tortispora caseinolytica NRRL Y-17796]|uniref:ATP citrate synthase n=1 Tax=Tortispora caseinolytica NRRL Y-17796 TaxID=767744 RepID=A0A1E4THM8_9ASCO|nr:hypothetical protein CANCADRAFT_121785 [Tortispora caseinolytica NRRL Y-17796]
MSAKSIYEADGKALLAYFLSRSKVYSESEPSTTFSSLPRLVPLRFESGGSTDAIFAEAEQKFPWVFSPEQRLVAKPDQLIKRRGKLGLVALNKTWPEAKQWVAERANKEVSVGSISAPLHSFLIEPFVPHSQDQEYYININSVREGDWILFYHEGGVDVGDVDAKASKILIPVDLNSYPSNEELEKALLQNIPQEQRPVLLDFINRLYAVYVDLQFTYLEINPLVVIPQPDGTVAVEYLDLAAKLDQTAEFECGAKWAVARSDTALGIAGAPQSQSITNIDQGPPMEFPAPFGRDLSKEEAYIAELDAKTGASLKLTVLNSKGRIWTLVAGGGASVVYADAIASAGFADELANYGEYSGAPTETQTYEYARTILDLMTRGTPHPDGKVLFIGGGIANFTQVGSTFKGIIRAFKEYQQLLHAHKVRMYVRRGGPNWQEGLRLITACAEELDLPMEIYGPDMHVSGIVPLALLGKRPTDIRPFAVTSAAAALQAK